MTLVSVLSRLSLFSLALPVLLVVEPRRAAAAEPPPAGGAPVVAIELSFSTHAGEGAAGRKRFFRDGCYEVESQGGAGGGQRVRDSQAGCHRRGDVAAAFEKVTALALGAAVVPEGSPRAEVDAHKLSGGNQERLTLVRADGSRWIPAQGGTLELLGAVDDLPSENQWYVKPPTAAGAKGPQLVVVNVSAAGHDGPGRLQASLTADGRWWCYRSVGARSSDAPKLSAKRPPPLSEAAARERLDRILRGARPRSHGDKVESNEDAAGGEISVEAAFAGTPRAPLDPARLTKTVAERFAAEMRVQSPACAAP